MLQWSELVEQEVHHQENITHRLCHEELQTSQVFHFTTLASGALKAA